MQREHLVQHGRHCRVSCYRGHPIQARHLDTGCEHLTVGTGLVSRIQCLHSHGRYQEGSFYQLFYQSFVYCTFYMTFNHQPYLLLGRAHVMTGGLSHFHLIMPMGAHDFIEKHGPT